MTTKKDHRELKPVKGNQGLTVSFGGKNLVSSRFREIKDKKGKVIKKEISESKTRFVPDAVIKSLNLPEYLFVGGPEKNAGKKETANK